MGVQAYNSKGEEIAVSCGVSTIASPKRQQIRRRTGTSPQPDSAVECTDAGDGPRRVEWHSSPECGSPTEAGRQFPVPAVLASTVSAGDGTFTIEKPLTGRLAIYALATDY